MFLSKSGAKIHTSFDICKSIRTFFSILCDFFEKATFSLGKRGGFGGDFVVKCMRSDVQGQFYGAVVAAVDFGMYRGTFEPVAEALGHEKIVDAPSGILFAGVETVGPP